MFFVAGDHGENGHKAVCSMYKALIDLAYADSTLDDAHHLLSLLDSKYNQPYYPLWQLGLKLLTDAGGISDHHYRTEESD